MKIEFNYLSDKFNNKYPFLYRIDMQPWQLHERERVLDWLTDIQLPCHIAGDGLYVEDHNAVTMIMLRWS
jgi:hypothetical protein